MFATDIDLLVIEPSLFADAGWSGQRLVSATGSLSASTLTIAGADLAAAQVEAGCVVLMSGVPLEVVDRLSATTLRVSLVRWGRTGPVIPPVGLSTGQCDVWTFRPQLALAHRHVLRLLGLSESTDRTGPGETLSESSVANPDALAALEALWALHIVYAAAGAGLPASSPLADKARQYALRAGAERTRVAALIDTDGDGTPDATRRPGIIPLLRS
ncbi:MAG: hypothetical protein K2Q09_06775 [Phycisphaerales bacterium]|nr:hypothetical protein [Phycisphaerales bacterium]